ncbi:hypothetical protein Avbf_17032 [Armadillidium vulgare]|nr:hypothetical protein Avbf_17032 [Armadillidium vulgare]
MVVLVSGMKNRIGYFKLSGRSAEMKQKKYKINETVSQTDRQTAKRRRRRRSSESFKLCRVAKVLSWTKQNGELVKCRNVVKKMADDRHVQSTELQKMNISRNQVKIPEPGTAQGNDDEEEPMDQETTD